ncbi:FAD/NAD(P)-binding protein [bacterium]|nr:FAD/NAD(P)-binding protein [bacterium]
MITFNPYAPRLCKLVEVKTETPTIKTFVLEMPEPFHFRAGQFIELTLPGAGEAPFTPSSSPLEHDRLETTVIRTGSMTDRLHEVEPGAWLGVRGPFGKGYPIEKYRGKEILVVGGGCGLAPLRSLIYQLLSESYRYRRISIKYGAREPDELLYRDSYATWTAERPNVDFTCTVDAGAPGWTGRVGLVTTLLSGLDLSLPDTVAFVCGPEVMLKFVTLTLLKEGLSAEQIYLSMNRRMSCGIGQCGRCSIGPYYLCKDGPDMNYAAIQQYENVF